MKIKEIIFLMAIFLLGMASCTKEKIDVPIEVVSPKINDLDNDDELKLIVHEWGTITSQHLSDGTQIGRLNKIDESEELPSFVYHFEPLTTQNNPERLLTKSSRIPGRPDVTMRLETPVMYFYSQESKPLSDPIRVEVSFRGGILNEYYPNAKASVSQDNDRINLKTQAGVIKEWNGDVLGNFVKSDLLWSVTGLPDKAPVPQTNDPVWLAPRNVDAQYVKTDSGESEKYLFYRGVAHLDALYQTQLANSELVLVEPESLHWLAKDSLTIPNTWIVEISANAKVAFAELGPIHMSKSVSGKELHRITVFNSEEMSKQNLVDLKQSMKSALINEGLFEKEADAMLKTWEASYFENPGLRVFYIVPNEWFEYHLPVNISVPHELERAFVGRIDVIMEEK